MSLFKKLIKIKSNLTTGPILLKSFGESLDVSLYAGDKTLHPNTCETIAYKYIVDILTKMNL